MKYLKIFFSIEKFKKINTNNKKFGKKYILFY